MSQKTELQIADIAPSGSTSGAYALVLSEVNGNRRLPIVIGGPEAQAIAIELEKMAPSRPLTHDLFRTLCNSFSIVVNEVLIYNLNEGIFYARITCTLDGRSVEIDARTSDAVAIAVRFNCPIYCLEFILQQAGVSSEDVSDDLPMEEPDLDLEEAIAESETESMSLDDLQRQLEQALDREDYERASRIRDEINRRKS
ncbi:MAG: bifunctional nuclease domain-containing protein [Flavobacteriales bacterium]|jgi:bifunctional DNase/RNase